MVLSWTVLSFVDNFDLIYFTIIFFMNYDFYASKIQLPKQIWKQKVKYLSWKILL